MQDQLETGQGFENEAKALGGNPDYLYSLSLNTAKAREEVAQIQTTVTDRDTSNRLLAPNGKPSHLSENEWKLVRTPSFKSWFGDWLDPENKDHGILIDDNGEPLIVWHALRHDIQEIFEIEKTLWEGLGSPRFQIATLKTMGVYFSKSRAYIDEFASHNPMKEICSVFLNVRNPYSTQEIMNSNALDPERVKMDILNKGHDSVVMNEGGPGNSVIVFDAKNIVVTTHGPLIKPGG